MKYFVGENGSILLHERQGHLLLDRVLINDAIAIQLVSAFN